MRVRPKMEISGKFWLPATPELVVAGTLCIEDGGDIHLEVIGSLLPWPDALTRREDPARVLGVVEKFGLVTLEKCIFETRNIGIGSGPARSRLYAHFAFLGVEYEKDEQPSFASFIFGVEALDDWHEITGITVAHDWDTHVTQVRYEPPKEIVLWSAEGASLTLKFHWTAPLARPLTKAVVTQESYLELRWPSPRPVDEFTKFAHEILQFLALGLDTTAALKDVRGFSPELTKEDGKEVPVSIFFRPLMHPEKPPEVEHWRRLFGYSDLAGRTGEALAAWRNLQRRAGPALNLYFSARNDPLRYLNVRFLFLIQAIEALHRRTFSETAMPAEEFAALKNEIKKSVSGHVWHFLSGKLGYANEPGLAKRLSRLMEPLGVHFGAPERRRELIQLIVTTRNYYTHFDKALEKRSAHGAELWDLCMKLEALFQLHLLSLLGFTEAELAGLISRNHHFAQKLRAHNPDAWPSSSENTAAPD